jgi:hypothetical protein
MIQTELDGSPAPPNRARGDDVWVLLWQYDVMCWTVRGSWGWRTSFGLTQAAARPPSGNGGSCTGPRGRRLNGTDDGLNGDEPMEAPLRAISVPPSPLRPERAANVGEEKAYLFEGPTGHMHRSQCRLPLPLGRSATGPDRQSPLTGRSHPRDYRPAEQRGGGPSWLARSRCVVRPPEQEGVPCLRDWRRRRPLGASRRHPQLTWRSRRDHGEVRCGREGGEPSPDRKRSPPTDQRGGPEMRAKVGPIHLPLAIVLIHYVFQARRGRYATDLRDANTRRCEADAAGG